MYANGDAVLSGFANGGKDMSIGEFKSGGNPEGCELNVAIIKAEVLRRSTCDPHATLLPPCGNPLQSFIFPL